MIEATPPATPLPPDVIELMKLTLDLADLIYWESTASEGSLAVQIRAEQKEMQSSSNGST